MKRFSMKKKLIAGGAALALAAGVGGAAFAFFTASGAGSGNGSVGESSDWVVSSAAPINGPLFPGVGTETVNYTVTNGSTSSAQTLNAVTTAISNTGGDVTNKLTDAVATGCKSAWFTVTNTPPTGLPASIAVSPGNTTGSFTITLDESNSAQDACQGVQPVVNISAS